MNQGDTSADVPEDLKGLTEAQGSKRPITDPRINPDTGRPYTLEEMEKLGVYDKYNKSGEEDIRFKYLEEDMCLYIYETGEFIEPGGTVRIPKGETYTIYELCPYNAGKIKYITGVGMTGDKGAGGGKATRDFIDREIDKELNEFTDNDMLNIQHNTQFNGRSGLRDYDVVRDINYVAWKVTGKELTEGHFWDTEHKGKVASEVTLWFDGERVHEGKEDKRVSTFYFEVYDASEEE